MPIPFACPFCELETLVDDEYAGTSGKCAGCDKSITVPIIPVGRPLGEDEIVVGMPQRRRRSTWAISTVVVATILAGLAVGGLLIALLFPALGAARSLAHHHSCRRNLERIAEALKAYEQEHGSIPPAYVVSADGVRMHSWRVLILPYLGEQGLHDKYNFNEPWNSIQNKALTRQVPNVYCCPSFPGSQLLGESNYFVIVGRETLFPGAEPRRLTQIGDDMETTIAVVESPALGIAWTEPRDLLVDNMQFVINGEFGKEIASDHKGGAYASMADGEVRFLSDLTPPDFVEAMTTMSGNEPVPLDFLDEMDLSF